MNTEQEPLSPCTYCKHYSRGSFGSLSHPDERNECAHPKHYALLTHTMQRSAMERCGHFEPKFKQLITYRLVENLPQDHALVRWFTEEIDRGLDVPVLSADEDSPQGMGWISAKGAP